MRGRDAVCNAVFRLTISYNLKILAIKSQNHEAKIKSESIGSKILGGKGPPKLDAETFMPLPGQHEEKFSGIPPTDPNNINQSTPNCWPVFKFYSLKIVRGRPRSEWACISKRWSSSITC